ncbi:MAG TPA: glycosyltransferase family 2 protein [Nitrolancea sp.]|jgi:glycosyltransferase involved in cell wall biosynthesis|nr:glycosyltransferase family 2 protein [Nitrolancea sp.]
MDSVRSVSIVFPAFNEENNLAPVILAAQSYLSQQAFDYRLIIVNDGSRDRTGVIAAQLARQNPAHLIVVTHESNRGYGAAVRSGFAAACQTGCDWVVLMDADGQFDIRELDLLLDVAGDRGIDLVAGKRVKRADSTLRRANAWLWSNTSRLLLGIRVHDVDCAFKLINRRVLETISLHGEAAVISPEILAKSARAGFTIAEVPVSHYPRHAGEQSGANLTVIVRSLVGLVQLRMQLIGGERHPGHKPQTGHVVSR